MAPLSALPSGAGLSWLTPGLGAHPSWLRAPGGRWAFVAAGWGSCAAFVPGRRGGLGEVRFVTPEESFSSPQSPPGLGRGWGGGVGSSGPLTSLLWSRWPSSPPSPPPPSRLPAPLFSCGILAFVRVPSLNKSNANLAQRTLPTALCHPQDSHVPCPPPRPCCGTPPFPSPLPPIHSRLLAHPQTFPGPFGSGSKL